MLLLKEFIPDYRIIIFFCSLCLGDLSSKIYIPFSRERFKKELRKLDFVFPDSMTNFIFARHKRILGEQIFQELKKRKIYVRHWNKPRISEYLRISIGTEEQMDKLLHALQEIVADC